MTDERDQNPDSKKRGLAMAARATVELFGDGAIAKTKERLAEVEADGNEEAIQFWRSLLEEVTRLHTLRHSY